MKTAKLNFLFRALAARLRPSFSSNFVCFDEDGFLSPFLGTCRFSANFIQAGRPSLTEGIQPHRAEAASRQMRLLGFG